MRRRSMPEDEGLACRGMVFADGVLIGVVDGTAGVRFEPDDGESPWACLPPLTEMTASVEMECVPLAALGASAPDAGDAVFSLVVDVLSARSVTRGASRADYVRLRHQCRRSARNLNLAMARDARRRERLEFYVRRISIPAARVAADGSETCAAGVPRGEPGVRPYGRHFRQADAGEREREKRPGTEND